MGEGGSRGGSYLKGWKGIWGDVKGRHLHVTEEVVEILRVEHDLGQRLVTTAFPEHHATVERNLLVFIPKHITSLHSPY